jgi:hypothetical protein
LIKLRLRELSIDWLAARYHRLVKRLFCFHGTRQA